MVTQWFVICAIIALVIFLPLVWYRIERRLDRTLLKGTSTFVRISILAGVIIVLELLLLGLIVSISKLNFVDTFFVSGMLLVCYVWLYPLFGHTKKQRNRLYMAGDSGKVKAFYMRFTPFVIGSTGFGMISLVTAVLYYYPYFI